MQLTSYTQMATVTLQQKAHKQSVQFGKIEILTQNYEALRSIITFVGEHYDRFRISSAGRNGVMRIISIHPDEAGRTSEEAWLMEQIGQRFPGAVALTVER